MSNECPICGDTVVYNKESGDYQCGGCGDTLKREEIEASFEAMETPDRVIAVNPTTGEWGSFVRGDNGEWCRIVKNADNHPQMVRRVPTNIDPLEWEVQWVSG